MKVIIKLIVLLLAVSCTQHDNTITPEISSKDAVILTVREAGTGERMETVLPGVPSSLTYKLSGTLSSGGAQVVFGTYPALPATAAVTPGTWDLVLDALDVNGSVVLSGVLTGKVVDSTLKSIDFILKPLSSGNGGFSLTVSWDTSGLVSSAGASINDVTADPAPVLSSTQAVLSRTGLAAGNYLVVIGLFNSSGALISTVTELVRVAPGLTSSKVIALTEAVDFNRPPAAVPTGFKATISDSMDMNYGSVYLEWTDSNNNESGFKLIVNKDGSFLETVSIPGGASTWYYRGLRNSSYTFQIAAMNNFGETAYTAVTIAVQIPLLYTITYKAPDGNGSMSTQYAEAGRQVYLYFNSFVRTGYIFIGWTSVPQGATPEFSDEQQITMGSGNLVLYAVWEIISSTRTVIFDSQGAETLASPSEISGITNGTPIANFPSVPVRNNYVFSGWWTVPETGGSVFTEYTPVSANITVYARWRPKLLTFTVSEGSLMIYENQKLVTIEVSQGTVITALTPTFTYSGDVVTVNSTSQTSGTSQNDFTSPLVYRISTTGGSYQDYAVRVIQSENAVLSPVTSRDMVLVPGGTFTQQSTDASNPSFSHTLDAFSVAKYEVTYELWYTVRNWAINSGGYNIVGAGAAGQDGTIGIVPGADKLEPVTNISWRDAMIWCNAYSELAGLTPVYYMDNSFTILLKTSTTETNINNTPGSQDNPFINPDANGYRLPTEGEWQYAASYTDYGNHQGYNYVSGDTSNTYDVSTVKGDYAIYDITGSADQPTQNVGSKLANGLGLYDMSGNAGEWCFDWYATLPTGSQTNYVKNLSGSTRVGRGGTGQLDSSSLQVGARNWGNPYYIGIYQGFRVVQSVKTETGTPYDKSSNIGQSFYYQVTGSTAGTCWGSDVYTSDSPVKITAVHAGKLVNGKTGVVKVTILPGMPTYNGTTANGVTTYSYGVYPLSYMFE